MKTFLLCVWFAILFTGMCDIASALTMILAVHTLRMVIGSSKYAVTAGLLYRLSP